MTNVDVTFSGRVLKILECEKKNLKKVVKRVFSSVTSLESICICSYIYIYIYVYIYIL